MPILLESLQCSRCGWTIHYVNYGYKECSSCGKAQGLDEHYAWCPWERRYERMRIVASGLLCNSCGVKRLDTEDTPCASSSTATATVFG